MDLGQRIKKAIEDSGMTAADVVKACDLKSVQAVYAWLRGDVKNILMAHLFALADATGKEARWIATGAGPEGKTRGDSQKDALLVLYDRLDARGKDNVLGAAERESTYAVSTDGTSPHA